MGGLYKDGKDADPGEITSFMNLQTIGDYKLVKLLGIGGMGEVFLAKQQAMNRLVALKILLPGLVNNQRYLERFFREVRTLAKIDHPCIVRAIEAGVENNICYFSMMYVEGRTIKSMLIEDGAFDEVEAMKIVRDTAVALDYVWNKHKIVHRDIKPANIILTGERKVKILDLGISKIDAESADEDLTKTGMMVGSPCFVSPEQARDDKVDFRADMYSLGATLYTMLTGEPPYDAENTFAIVAKHLNDPIPDPREINEAISMDTVSLIEQMLAKDRKDRFKSWEAFIKRINRIIARHERSRSAGGWFAYKILSLKAIPGMLWDGLANRRHFGKIIFVSIVIAACVCVVLAVRIKQEQNKRNRMIEDALAFAEKSTPEQRLNASRRLKYIIENAPEGKYAARARELLDKLQTASQKETDRKELDKVKNLLKAINDKSLELEREEQYDEAIKLWTYYLENSPFKRNKVFAEEAAKSIEYFKFKLQEQENK